MSAVLRLAWTYFAASKLTRGCTAAGLVCAVVGIAGYVWQSDLAVAAAFGPNAGWYGGLMLSLPPLGLMLVLGASTLMPVVVERIALGRSIWLLPRGRICLLASVVLVAALLSLLAAAISTTLLILLDQTMANAAPDLPAYDYVRELCRISSMVFADLGLIYTAIWLVSKTSGIWRLGGMLGVVVSLTLPLSYFSAVGRQVRMTPLEWIGLASWLVFAVSLLAGGRLRHSFGGVRQAITSLGRLLSPSVRYAQGDEAALMLGTTHPWIVAFGQVVPIAVMVGIVPDSEVYIVFLMVFSAISGAITSQAAARSRRLWLHFAWTREQIASRTEAAYWRYNAWSLAVLLVVYLGLSLYFDFSVEALGLGIALLVAGSVVCTYLGFMITRSLGWFESALCVLTMTGLTLAGIAIMRQQYVTSIEFIGALAALAFIFRFMARNRWLELDWMQCRFETPARGAA
jgi:thiosulfate reductase cytochrome b subunit